MFELGFIIFFCVLGYITGSIFEKRHYQSIIRREGELKSIPVTSTQWSDDQDWDAKLFYGGVVVGSDYFKTFVSALRNIVGGRMTAYESLLDRGRREAILRMKEEAAEWGAEQILNLRIETSTMSRSDGNRNSMPSVELFAYGTAIRRKA